MGRFDASQYWETRYSHGRHSGAGSRGENLARKAKQINHMIRSREIKSVIDWGFGDSHLLELLKLPEYLGVDVSRTAVGVGLLRFGHHQFFKWNPESSIEVSFKAELAISADVIFHLVDDATYYRYMSALFGSATRHVMVWAPNETFDEEAPHVRNREWVRDVKGWALEETPIHDGPWVFSR